MDRDDEPYPLWWSAAATVPYLVVLGAWLYYGLVK